MVNRTLCWLIGLMFVLTPLSMANQLPVDVSLFKYARVALTLLLAFLTLGAFRIPSTRHTAYRFFVLGALFTLAAVWSDSPVRGLLYKGLFFLCCVIGISLGNRLKTKADIDYLLKVSVFVGIWFAGGIYAGCVSGYGEIQKGRLIVAGINPNLLSQSATIFAVLALFRYCVVRRGRLLSGASFLFMCSVIVLSGSRSGFLLLVGAVAVIIGCVVLKSQAGMIRFAISIGIGAIAIIVPLIAFGVVGNVSASDKAAWAQDEAKKEEGLRLQVEFTKNTRSSVWRAAGRKIKEAPMFGHGWLNRGGKWVLLQSSYLQIVMEMGIVGLVLLLWFLVPSLKLAIGALDLRRVDDPSLAMYRLFFGIAALGMLLYGVFEANLIVGTAPNALVLVYALTQLDRMRDHRLVARPAPVSSLARQTT